jgi:hypothetical protein
MGRPQRPIDPADGPVAEFAAGLRRLRADGGNPSYRVMARRSNYSVTTLSDAAGGRQLPTLAVTLAFVKACGGDPAEWASKWHGAASGRPEPAIGTTISRPDAPPLVAQLMPPTGTARPASPSSQSAAGRRRFGAWALVVAFAVGAVVGGAGAAIGLNAMENGVVASPGPDGRPLPALPSPWRAVEYRTPDKTTPADAMDPIRAGCGTVAELLFLDAVPVALPDGSKFGELVMRHSPRCQMSWGRVAGPVDPHRQVFITAFRPTDHVATISSYEGESTSAYGWMLSTKPGCVYIEAYVSTPDGNGPVARTRCL